MRALAQITAEDVIHVGGGTEERRHGVLAYEHAFRDAEPRLATEALAPPDPGWDMTVRIHRQDLPRSRVPLDRPAPVHRQAAASQRMASPPSIIRQRATT
ncbi:hypothetical protein FHX44_112796 [Pseudonocardia hierapolitana]|uniref:Uncharacterized protein n=1 Tax=Pseudonocardia hierapolitana TaxID=1128676 RepID=A0A561SPU6_9PSEU|nr:hypothetical protein [Pseudonocardia hierapolitana]TWF76898.1 hypothetical protein FHX44_112796 [Pseudonocardia hierapolitana]